MTWDLMWNAGLSLRFHLGHISLVVFHIKKEIRDLKIHHFCVQAWVNYPYASCLLPRKNRQTTQLKVDAIHYHFWELTVKFRITTWQTCSSTRTRREKWCILRSQLWDTTYLQNQKKDPENRERDRFHFNHRLKRRNYLAKHNKDYHVLLSKLSST